MANLTPDWILQETLAVQRKAIMDYVSGKAGNDGMTLTVLGCGTLGTAILSGIFDSLAAIDASGTDKASEDLPSRLPTKFNACVRRQQSADRIKHELAKHNLNLVVCQDDHVSAVQEADVVLLGCKPYMIADIFKSNEMKRAFKNKLLISILAGVTEEQLRITIYGEEAPLDACTIVRAMPNTAAAVRQSMTVIGVSNPPLEPETRKLVTWMFTRIGRVSYLPSANMDVCTALCGSGPAFVSVILESMAAGAIAMGLPRDDAYTMAAQVMRGTTDLILLNGEHPAVLRDKVTTPGGCTIGGLLVLEEGAVRGTVAKAVREATVVASQLGEGKKGVNGTRH